MQKIHLEIERVRSNQLRDEVLRTSLLFGVFFVGILFGFLISYSLVTSFHLSRIDKAQLVGAAALALPSSSFDTALSKDTSEVPEITILSTETASISATTPTLTISQAISQDTTPSVRELQLLATDKQIAMDRLDQEIERMKNASVALIAAFDQNCGSWIDTCATPYSTELYENNATYAELTQKRTVVQAELVNTKAALAAFNQ